MGLEIIISGQYGGSDAGGAVQHIITECKKKLHIPINAAGNQHLKVKCTLYVSGEITVYKGISGYSNIRLQLARGYVSCDITMQPEIWKEGPELILNFFMSTLISAINEIILKLNKNGIFMDVDQIKNSIEALNN